MLASAVRKVRLNQCEAIILTLRTEAFDSHNTAVSKKLLNERVNAYLRDNNISGRDVPAMYFKTVITLAWWLSVYLLLLLGHFSPAGQRCFMPGVGDGYRLRRLQRDA